MELPQKTKEEVLTSMLGLSISEFRKAAEKFKKFYGESVPKEFKPLSLVIYDELKEKEYVKPFSDTHFRIKNIDVYMNFYREGGVFQMFPCRKIKELEDIRSGNSFFITSYGQYKILVNFLENL